MASCESRFTTDILLVDVAFKRVHSRFELEAPDVQFNCINILCSLSLSPIRIVEKFSFSFPFSPRLLYIFELTKNGSRAAIITDNKIRF